MVITDGVNRAPGVVAVPLISDPVCDTSCRSIAVGAVTVLLVTTVEVDSAETTWGPWSGAASMDCLSLFAS